MPTRFLRILFFSLCLRHFHSQNIKSTAQIAFDNLSLSSHNTFTFLHHTIPLLPTTHYWQFANTLLSRFVCYSLVALISFLQFHFCNTQLIIHSTSHNLLLSEILDSFWIPKTLPISTIFIIIITTSFSDVFEFCVFFPLLLLLSIVLLSLLSSSMLFGLPIMQSVIIYDLSELIPPSLRHILTSCWTRTFWMFYTFLLSYMKVIDQFFNIISSTTDSSVK